MNSKKQKKAIPGAAPDTERTNGMSGAHRLIAPLIYRKVVVLAKLGISETTLRRWMADEDFPRPRQLGPRAVGWIAEEVDAWLSQRPIADSNAID